MQFDAIWVDHAFDQKVIASSTNRLLILLRSDLLKISPRYINLVKYPYFL